MENKNGKYKAKVLLALLPYWNPLIPPQGLARMKSYLTKNDFFVKTVDANLDGNFKNLYQRYLSCLKDFIPHEKHGNYYNIVNDVWREHMMAYINKKEEAEYFELVKILICKFFYTQIKNNQLLHLEMILAEYYQNLEEYIIKLVDKEMPDVIGISTYRDTLASTVFAFRLIRQKYPNINTVMGGGIFTIQLTKNSPNLNLFMDLTKDYIDKIMIGNGEQLLHEFLDKKLDPDKRLYDNSDLRGNKMGIHNFISPDFSDFDYSNYYYLAAQGSTSCPNQCNFCNVAAFYGEYKNKDAKKTADEMVYLHKTHKLQLFHMLDALLNPIVFDLSDEIEKRKVPIYWDGYFRVDQRANDINNVFKWRKGGFYRARIGVESGSQKILDQMGKEIKVEDTIMNIRNLATAGIKTTAYIVIGYPGETEQDFQATLDLMEELKYDIWEAECNPFTYFYSGQAGNDHWAQNRISLYPEYATQLLMYKTWIVNCEPSREVIFERVNRFVEHTGKLGISIPWNLYNINKSDIRWKKLHKNAVPGIVELSKRGEYLCEKHSYVAEQKLEKIIQEDGDFGF